jgi:hypothetical protein
VNDLRWFNPRLPQTLLIATYLLYSNAFFTAVYGGLASVWGVAIVAGCVGGAVGIASEKRWGYYLGVAMSFLPFFLRLAFLGVSGMFGGNILNLAFEVALVALLLHPMSRDYQRIWFRK